MSLDQLAARINELHRRLSLRKSLEDAIEIGELLLQCKAQIPHGEWEDWRADNLDINERTARDYQAVAKRRGTAVSDKVTITEFLTTFKRAKRAARYEEMQEARQAAVAAAGYDDGRFIVRHADATKFKWPRNVDLIATDPPWKDLNHFRWLGKMAFRHLVEGGLLMVQCGTKDVPDVLPILSGAGLEYVWINAIVYEKTFVMAGLTLNVAWRPVLVFSRGKWNTTGLDNVSDTVTSNFGDYVKQYHPWQQPAKPWYWWISRLTRPNALIADPFCGSGTNGAATKAAGAGRRFLGTEIDAETAKVAQGRINETEEGKPLMK